MNVLQLPIDKIIGSAGITIKLFGNDHAVANFDRC